jgi:hypothetical protein
VCARVRLTDSDTVGRMCGQLLSFTCFTSIKVQILTPERQALVIPSLVCHILEPSGTFVILLYH